MLRAATAGCVATPRDSWALGRVDQEVSLLGG